jgi:hypothetical protein
MRQNLGSASMLALAMALRVMVSGAWLRQI